MMVEKLKMINVTKVINNKMILKGCSLSIEKGSIYGLVGPNGAGKSTIMKILGGIYKPTSGKVIFDDHEWRRSDLSEIGSLIESPALYENLSSHENLKVLTLLMGIDDARIVQVLNLVHLNNFDNKKVKDFSFGMKQRLGLAIALLNNPNFMILDEPTNGLDPEGINELEKIIFNLKDKGVTILLSSHMLSEVSRLSDRFGFIKNGIFLEQRNNNGERMIEQDYFEIMNN